MQYLIVNLSSSSELSCATVTEPDALAGFSIERFQPALVCIEAHLPIRNQILEYFARHAYVVAGQYLRADSANLWFVPLSS